MILSVTEQRINVMNDTWGHLAPEPGEKYPGYIIVAKSFSGDSIIFDYNFETLEGGPWLWSDICNFAFEEKDIEFETPSMYRFDGWYKKFKNGNCRFGGGDFKKLLPERAKG